jgi:four helix bundle protein
MTNQRQDLNARAFKLAARVFKLFPKLVTAGSGHAYIARQLLRATASIGANLEEGSAASSRRDMAQKYSIALRESREGKYWSRLLATDPTWSSTLEDVIQETSEFVAMLTVSVRKLRLPAGSSHPLNVRGRAKRKSRPLSFGRCRSD